MASRIGSTLARWWFTPRIRSTVLTVILSVMALGVGIALGAWQRACAGNTCPSVARLVHGKWDPAQAAKVFAADGRLITDLGEERRTVVSIEQISPAAVAAFLSVEDKRFYEHHGVDWVRFFGALYRTTLYKLTGRGRLHGFSTITMQLAGNIFSEIDRQDRSIKRKLREMQVAFEIEDNFSKNQVLELYLNQINLGNGAFGIEAAAQRYFGKPARDLNLAEAATLAGIPRSPTRYNPRRSPDLSVERRNLILDLMAEEDVISRNEAERWKAYPLVLSARSDFSDVAPYFVEYVRQQLRTRFPTELYRAGLRIYTTIDLDVQLAAERALTRQLDEIERNRTKYPNYPRPGYADYLEKRREDAPSPRESPYLQGLAVVLEARTGRILAMVGGRDYNDSKFNRAVQALRQPGSTFKPIVYTAALRAGHPWTEIVVDDPISVEMLPGEPPWEPMNYDNKFGGPMPLKEAFYESRNIPAIKVGMEIGAPAVIGEAARFGITTPIPPYPSIHIGSAGVYPIELISAYSAFANMGSRTTPFAVERVEDKNGNVLWAPRPRSEQVMDSALAWLMLDGLRDVVRRGTAAGSVGSQFQIPAGGKTGTTNDYGDVWFVGFTPDLVAGVWIGMDKPQRIMDNAQGGRLAAPAWTMMMKDIYERRPVPAVWVRPDGLTFVEVDRQSGERFSPFCPRDSLSVESFLPGTEPRSYCRIHDPWGGGVQGGNPLSPGQQPGAPAPPAPPPTPPRENTSGGSPLNPRPPR
ncbi:MAG: PBP1A family penicillin-binding protein [Gemmatimonadetes bacterium]|nr:PBP1A family penicillin-binding protein [Gemmatimonadota bacterium]